MSEQPKQPEAESGRIEAPQGDQGRTMTFLKGQIKRVAAPVLGAVLGVMAAGNTGCIAETKGTNNNNNIDQVVEDPGYEGCAPFQQCGVLNTTEGCALTYKVPSGRTYTVNIELYGLDGQLFDVQTMELSGMNVARIPGEPVSKVVWSFVNPDTDKQIVTEVPPPSNY